MLHGILDPQPGKLAFGLFDDGRCIRSAYCQMHPRDASQIPHFIGEQLDRCGVKLHDITRWTFGCGPGSFTFLRVVAALGAGWAAGTDRVKFRCIPGAVAAAAALNPQNGEKVGVIYDGRNREMLCFMLKCENGILTPTGEELIMNAEKALDFFSREPVRLAAFDTDKEILYSFLGDEIPFSVIEPDLSAFDKAPGAFDNDADKMCYIRPAVNN